MSTDPRREVDFLRALTYPSGSSKTNIMMAVRMAREEPPEGWYKNPGQSRGQFTITIEDAGRDLVHHATCALHNETRLREEDRGAIRCSF